MRTRADLARLWCGMLAVLHLYALEWLRVTRLNQRRASAQAQPDETTSALLYGSDEQAAEALFGHGDAALLDDVTFMPSVRAQTALRAQEFAYPQRGDELPAFMPPVPVADQEAD